MKKFVLTGIAVGFAAALSAGTALADLWAETQKRLLKVPTPSWPMVGRWVAHLRHGQFIHDSIAKAPPVPGEALLGWATHYVIGVLYAGLLLVVATTASNRLSGKD